MACIGLPMVVFGFFLSSKRSRRNSLMLGIACVIAIYALFATLKEVDAIASDAFSNTSNIFLVNVFGEVKIDRQLQDAVSSLLIFLDEKIVTAHCSAQMGNYLDVQTISTLKALGRCYTKYNPNPHTNMDRLKRLYVKP